MTEKGRGRSRGGRAKKELRLGVDRVRISLWPIAWVALATGIAYWLAGALLGHQYPFFAAVAAFSALGFSPDIRSRQVGEVALGISVGVGLGELIVVVFGAGPIQTAIVVFVAALIGRLLDPSRLLTTQSGVQAIVVVGLPVIASTGGPVGRWTDALLGGAVALVFSLLVPHDPRRRPRQLAKTALDEVAVVLGGLADGLRDADEGAVEEALDQARSTEALLAEWTEAVGSAASTTRMSPAWRRHLDDANRLVTASVHTDRAIRTARVLARRVLVLARDGHRDEEFAEVLQRLSAAVSSLGPDLKEGHDPYTARTRLLAVAQGLGYSEIRDPVRHGLVGLTRSTTFDLLQVAGVDEDEARAALP